MTWSLKRMPTLVSIVLLRGVGVCSVFPFAFFSFFLFCSEGRVRVKSCSGANLLEMVDSKGRGGRDRVMGGNYNTQKKYRFIHVLIK